MKLILLLLIALSLGCSEKEETKVAKPRQTVDLEIMLFDDLNELNNYIDKNYEVKKLRREGFARWYTDGTDCKIFLHRVNTEKEFDKLEAVYGHELMHCIYGSFHKE
jgi:hypothetical protein